MNTIERIKNGEFNNKVKFPKRFSTTEDRKKYFNEEARIKEELKDSLLKEFNLLYHPKSRKCFEIAWELGHKDGIEKVYNFFVRIEELL